MSIKVLLVDDDITLLDCISQGLALYGYTVYKADNGKDAVNFAHTKKPDVILLDVVLPDISGGEVAKILEKDPVTDDIPIIFLTGLITQSEDHKVIKGRAFIGKPYSVEDIDKEIKKQIGNRHG